MADLPTEQTCVIDMSISQEGVIDRLLFGVMEVERPEFEGQRKSIQSDMLHHQHELNKEHVRTTLSYGKEDSILILETWIPCIDCGVFLAATYN